MVVCNQRSILASLDDPPISDSESTNLISHIVSRCLNTMYRVTAGTMEVQDFFLDGGTVSTFCVGYTTCLVDRMLALFWLRGLAGTGNSTIARLVTNAHIISRSVSEPAPSSQETVEMSGIEIEASSEYYHRI